MTPRRVLHVLATAHESGAGVNGVVRSLAQALDPGRYRLHAWFLGGDGPWSDALRMAGVPVRTFAWTARRSDLTGAWRFWWSLRRERFAVVHLHFGGRLAPFLVRSALRTKIVLHLHGSGVEGGSAGPLVVRPWAADRVVTVSDAVARMVVGRSASVIHHGIDVMENIPRDAGSMAGRPAFIGAAARLVPIKGIVYLVRAVAALSHRIENVHLEVAGAGPEEEALRAAVSALGLTEHVTFLGWQGDMRPLYARWDVFVQPSLDEGWSMATLEAMAAGLPVVGTSAGGLPELIEDGRTGYVVEPADVQALADRLCHLLLNPDRRHAMGEAGRMRARERFGVARMAAGVAGVYDQLLAASPQSRWRSTVTQ